MKKILPVSRAPACSEKKQKITAAQWVIIVLGTGLMISLAGMMAEGFASFYFQWQKHNSMYFLLIPVMFFLFELLLSMKGREMGIARDLSMYIYILHPFCIVLVRGLAGVLKAQKLLVEQSLLHYLAVSAVSVLLSLVFVLVKQWFWSRRSYV